MVPEPSHARRAKAVAVGVFHVRWMSGSVVVGDRINHQLAAQRGTALVAGHKRHYRDQVSARAVARDHDARGIGAQFARMRGGPLGGGVAVVGAGGKLGLRRQAVINRNHDASGGAAQVAAGAVVRVEIAHDKTAAVKEHHQGKRPAPVGSVDAHRQVAGGSRNHAVDDRRHRQRRQVSRPAALDSLGPRIFN